MLIKKKIKVIKKKVKNRKGKRSKIINFNKTLLKLLIKLIFFDLILILKNFIIFNIFKNIYYSLAFFINKLIKLFKSCI